MTKFRRLRGLLKAEDIDRAYLAELLGYCTSTISLNMTGKRPWNIWDMYKIMDILGLDDSRLAEVFPRDGIEQPKKPKLPRLRVIRIENEENAQL